MNDQQFNDLKVGENYWFHAPHLIKGIVTEKHVSWCGVPKQFRLQSSKHDREWVPITNVVSFGSYREPPTVQEEEAMCKEETKEEEPSALVKTRLHNVIRYIETLGDSWQFVEIHVKVRDHNGNSIFTATIEDELPQ